MQIGMESECLLRITSEMALSIAWQDIQFVYETALESTGL